MQFHPHSHLKYFFASCVAQLVLFALLFPLSHAFAAYTYTRDPSGSGVYSEVSFEVTKDSSDCIEPRPYWTVLLYSDSTPYPSNEVHEVTTDSATFTFDAGIFEGEIDLVQIANTNSSGMSPELCSDEEGDGTTTLFTIEATPPVTGTLFSQTKVTEVVGSPTTRGLWYQVNEDIYDDTPDVAYTVGSDVVDRVALPKYPDGTCPPNGRLTIFDSSGSATNALVSGTLTGDICVYTLDGTGELAEGYEFAGFVSSASHAFTSYGSVANTGATFDTSNDDELYQGGGYAFQLCNTTCDEEFLAVDTEGVLFNNMEFVSPTPNFNTLEGSQIVVSTSSVPFTLSYKFSPLDGEDGWIWYALADYSTNPFTVANDKLQYTEQLVLDQYVQSEAVNLVGFPENLTSGHYYRLDAMFCESQTECTEIEQTRRASDTIYFWAGSVPENYQDILQGLVQATTTPYSEFGSQDCEINIDIVNAVCSLAAKLFIPETSDLYKFHELNAALKERAPFGYAYLVLGTFTTITLDTTATMTPFYFTIFGEEYTLMSQEILENWYPPHVQEPMIFFLQSMVYALTFFGMYKISVNVMKPKET